MRQPVILVGSLLFLVWGVLACHFYLERTAFLDLAYHLFHIIGEDRYAVQNHRFVSLFTQSFPRVGARMALDLDTIMQLYSLSFVVLYSGVFAILVAWMRATQVALAFLLMLLLLTTHTFFWVQSELPQGLAVLFLYMGTITLLTDRPAWGHRWWYGLLLVALIATVVFAHPLMIIPFSFVTAFLWLSRPALRRWVGTGFGVFLVLRLIKALFFKTEYDAQAMGGLHNFVRFFPDYFSQSSHRLFLQYVAEGYYVLILALLIVLGVLVLRKQYLLAGLLAAFFGAYLLLIHVSYPQGGDQFYMENLYLPLALFVALPLAFEVLPGLNKRLLLLLLMGLLIVRTGHIVRAATIYTDRVDYLSTYLEESAEQASRKHILGPGILSVDTMMMTWAVPYECWLLSTHKGGETRSVIAVENVEEWYWIRPARDQFITSWGVYPYEALPSRYFQFSDDSEYIIIEPQ